MSKNSFELEQTDICRYLKTVAGYRFVYQKKGSYYNLYCFNGRYWQTDDVLLRSFISNELFEFLKTILAEVYWESKQFAKMKAQLNRLKVLRYKKDIVESYKENGCNEEIEFDDKCNLFGFNNKVYDLEIGEFREYHYDDYISITTGYDWREPTVIELKTVESLIQQVMPIPDEREIYLQILSTALDGRCVEKFVIFNGSGGNGKGMLDDLLLIGLGHHGLLGNNSILFETSKTGSNPEKANIHKKRLVIFREPPEKQRFQNSIVKELTGGGKFSARTHHEKETEKELNLTMIVECNKRPLFAEEPKDSEVRRIIDLYFRSTFTDKTEIVNNDLNIYQANPHYKTIEFQQKHKYALIKILMNAYKQYKANKYTFKLPKSIDDRTQSYLEMSCNIVEWFKDHYQYTDDREQIAKLKDVYDRFSQSNYFLNLSKSDKQKYKKSYFVDYVKNNIFFRKYYCERTNDIKNFIRHWIPKTDEIED